MKKIFTLILALLILTVLAPSVLASRTLPLAVDNADILTSAEEESLNMLLENISVRCKLEIAVVTVSSTGGKSAEAYADDFYDYNGYGYGENDDGALLLVDMGNREWHISTHGYGAYVFDNHALYMIENEFIDSLSSGDYLAAFSEFAYACEIFAENDGYYSDYEEPTMASFILPSVIVGFIISLIVVLIMRSGMKTVRPARGAADYIVKDSLNLRMSSDRYLYTNVVRTKKQSSSSGGGSSMHKGSSGRSHGGRGGRF